MFVLDRNEVELLLIIYVIAVNVPSVCRKFHCKFMECAESPVGRIRLCVIVVLRSQKLCPCGQVLQECRCKQKSDQ